MAINPDTNKIEPLDFIAGELVRPDGSPVPKHWATFRVDELVVIKDYTFRVAYIGESNILFEPVSAAVPSQTPEGAAEVKGLTSQLTEELRKL